MDIADILDKAAGVISCVAADLMDADHLDVQSKAGAGNLVTRWDVETQRRLAEALPTLGAGGLALAEEGDAGRRTGPLNGWVVDPIDGTQNFAHRLPSFSISAALVVDDVVQAGIVHDPWLHETFTAILGAGSFVNGLPLTCSGRTDLSDSLIVTGRPYSRDLHPGFLALFEQLVHNAGGIRIRGCASLDICYVAAGRTDGYAEQTLEPWDFAAAHLIAAEAGCAMSRFGGDSLTLDRGSVIVTTPGIHDQLRGLVNGLDRLPVALRPAG